MLMLIHNIVKLFYFRIIDTYNVFLKGKIMQTFTDGGVESRFNGKKETNTFIKYIHKHIPSIKEGSLLKHF